MMRSYPMATRPPSASPSTPDPPWVPLKVLMRGARFINWPATMCAATYVCMALREGAAEASGESRQWRRGAGAARTPRRAPHASLGVGLNRRRQVRGLTGDYSSTKDELPHRIAFDAFRSGVSPPKASGGTYICGKPKKKF